MLTFPSLLYFLSAMLAWQACHGNSRKISQYVCVKPRLNDCNISTQHIATVGATCCVLLATLLRRVAILRYAAFKCCNRLARAFKCWANNVGICCVATLRSFGGALDYSFSCGTLANHKGHKQHSEPITRDSKSLHVADAKRGKRCVNES